MYNPNQFKMGQFPNSASFNRSPNPIVMQQPVRPVNITKFDSTRTRWDKPIEVPEVLYKKFKLEIPKTPKKDHGKTYPAQLLEYIGRCYGKCTNETEMKYMEGALRKLVNDVEGRLLAINWNDYEIPKIPKTTTPSVSKPATSSAPMIIKANKQTPISSKSKVEVESGSKSQAKAVVVPKFQFRVDPKVETKKFPKIEVTLPPPIPMFSFRAQPSTPKPNPQEFKKTDKSSKSQKKSAKTTKADKKQLKAERKAVVPQPSEPKTLVIIQQSNLSKRIQRLNRFRGPTTRRQVQQDEFQVKADHKVVGTSKEMEKPYLRITSMPDASTVRSQPVLHNVLSYLLQRYQGGASYEYISEQFRSLRQDLTVQHIRNSLTVEVYEQNSKISLFADDLGQFHQCQSALWDLYRSGVYKSLKTKNRFIGYQLLTLIMDQKFRELQYSLIQLKEDELESQEVQDILRVRTMIMMGNYSQFFQFYNTRDPLTRCLLNQYMDKIRASCVAMFAKTFGQKMPVSQMSSILGDSPLLLQQLIVHIGGVIRDGVFFCKESHPKIQACEFLLKNKNRVTLTLG